MRSLEWKQVVGKLIHGNIFLWLVMKELSIFSAQRSTSFQILYCVLVRYTRTPNQTVHGKTDWDSLKHLRNTEILTELMVSQLEFEWNIFPGFNTLQLSQEVERSPLRLGETPENFTGRIIFMLMFNDISCRTRDNEKECESNAQLVSLYAKRFGIGQLSFLGPGSEKKWYSIRADSAQGDWDRIAEKMMLEFAQSDIQFSVLRVHCPEVGSKAKAMENCRYTIVPKWKRLKLFFAQIFLPNQLSLYEAAAQMCEEYETLPVRSGQLVVGGQSSSSLVPSVIKTEMPLDCDDLVNKEDLLL